MLDVVIFTALGWERRAVTVGLEGASSFGARRWQARLQDGSSCLVVQTGMGPERARTAAREVPPARMFLACGCAGALASFLRAGDMVLADRVVAVDARGRTSDLPATAEPVATWLVSHGTRVHVGPILSTPTILTSASPRPAGGADALAVEMENGGVAAEALARGIPFVGLRVILDREDQAVPFTDAVDEATGETRTARAVATLAVRPWLWPAAGRLAWQASVAERELRRVMRGLTRAGASAMIAGPVAATAVH
jgi:4-hydroxy-3-methylbut-2-en-1-yl diphosphate reductase